jgi:hypothetical protein
MANTYADATTCYDRLPFLPALWNHRLRWRLAELQLVPVPYACERFAAAPA